MSRNPAVVTLSDTTSLSFFEQHGFAKLLNKSFDGGNSAQSVDVRSIIPVEADLDASRLPKEVQLRVFQFAMTAKGGFIFFSGSTSGEAGNPNIATALLRVSKEMYHDARKFLYSENTFVIQNFGTEIQVVTPLMSLEDCRLNRCLHANKPIILNNVCFQVGDSEDPLTAETKAHGFMKALMQLQAPAHINTLAIDLLPYSFRSNAQLEGFLCGFHNIKVHQKLVIRGLAVRLSAIDIRLIPKNLRMNLQPAHIQYSFGHAPNPATPDIPEPLITFVSYYEPAETMEQMSEWPGRKIVDVMSTHREWVQNTMRQESMSI